MHPPPDLTAQALDTSGDSLSKYVEAGPLTIVGGCGHVGLPLGLAFSRKGFHVDLVDMNAEHVACVNSGRMPFHEDDADTLLAEAVTTGRLRATTDTAVVKEASAVIITVGTPVDEHLDPSIGAFDKVIGRL